MFVRDWPPLNILVALPLAFLLLIVFDMVKQLRSVRVGAALGTGNSGKQVVIQYSEI